MKTALLTFAILLAAPQGGFHHFSKEGLAFDYPVAWTFADTGDAQLQRLILTRAGASNIILVFAQREPVTTAAQLNESRTGVTLPYVTTIAHKLGLERPPRPAQALCVPVGGRPAVGFRMSGILEGQPATAEVYTVVLGQRLLHLVHVRAEKDEAEGAAAWKTLLDTLKVDAPAQPSPEADKTEEMVAGGLLNDEAVKKPQPEYPSAARRARVTGTVAVQVVIDEKGLVSSAQAVAGHPLLRGAGEDAARRAKFTPTTLCGRPVKVSGFITYNFMRM